jgi:hypothetical protein
MTQVFVEGPFGFTKAELTMGIDAFAAMYPDPAAAVWARKAVKDRRREERNKRRRDRYAMRKAGAR